MKLLRWGNNIRDPPLHRSPLHTAQLWPTRGQKEHPESSMDPFLLSGWIGRSATSAKPSAGLRTAPVSVHHKAGPHTSLYQAPCSCTTHTVTCTPSQCSAIIISAFSADVRQIFHCRISKSPIRQRFVNAAWSLQTCNELPIMFDNLTLSNAQQKTSEHLLWQFNAKIKG